MVGISTYGLQIIRAPDVIFLWLKWQPPPRRRRRERRRQIKNVKGNWWGWMNDSTGSRSGHEVWICPLGFCLLTGEYRLLPHNLWQLQTLVAFKHRDSCVLKAEFGGTDFATRALVRAWIYWSWKNIRHRHSFGARVSVLVDFNSAVVTSCEPVCWSCHISTVFYSNVWQRLSNIRKHTSHNHKHMYTHKTQTDKS